MSQQLLLPAEDCVEALVMAGGNTHLAAERLFPDTPNAVAHLTASLAQDPLANEKLNAQLRTLIVLQAFDTLNLLKAMIPTVLTDLDPADFVKFYSQLLATNATLTAPSAASLARANDPAQLMEILMSKMPPPARKAFLRLIEGQSAPASVEPFDESEERLSGGYAPNESAA